MNTVNTIDWALLFGVSIFGAILAVYLKSKYKIQKRDFFFVSIYVAALASILIGAYHLLRETLPLTP